MKDVTVSKPNYVNGEASTVILEKGPEFKAIVGVFF